MKQGIFLIVVNNCQYIWSFACATQQGAQCSDLQFTSSALCIFKDIPVSLFAGLPKIDVPLYHVVARAIGAPLSLLYHASGFRPGIKNGVLSYSWSLFAGGESLTIAR